MPDILVAYVDTSALACTELLRAADRLGHMHVQAAEIILATIAVVPVSPTILDRAGRLLPGSTLRSLDAIHLASALALPSVHAFVTYDVRQADAAAVLGLPAVAPA